MHLQILLVSDFEIALITVITKVLMDGNNASLEISKTLDLMSTIVTKLILSWADSICFDTFSLCLLYHTIFHSHKCHSSESYLLAELENELWDCFSN